MRDDGEDAYDRDGMRSEIEEVSESEDDAGEESSSLFCLPDCLPRLGNSLRAPLLSLPPPAR